MSTEFVVTTLENTLKDGWVSTTPIDWDNVDYSSVQGVSFIRPTIDFVDDTNKGLRCFREYYQMVIQVFTPTNQGVIPNVKLCDSLLSIFKGKSHAGIVCFSGRSERIGDERNWHHRNVILDFYYDQNY